MKCHNHTYELNRRRKEATVKTVRINKEIAENINEKGLAIEMELSSMNKVVDIPYPVIESEDYLLPVWNLERYRFLNEEETPYTCNPKLWQQGRMNLNSGVFQVTKYIYQVRGFDLANMAFIQGRNGWIVVDSLTSKETAEAAIEVMNKCVKDQPISAVIITHSHVDHYGGVLGVLDEETLKNVKVYVPQGFMQAVIDENVYAGVAMTRRGFYMYGEILERDGKGQVDCGIGKYVSTGTVTLTDQLTEIKQPDPNMYSEYVIDGVNMQFILTLDTEAPSEMDFYIPRDKCLCVAENCNATLHNIYTLRGAKVRDPVAWAADIQKAINLWGDELTSLFEVHTWPRFGNAYCIDYMEKQRDLYQYINDQSLRLLNKGYTLEQIGRMVKFPESLSKEWYNSGFYGTVNHNSKAVYQRYMGWYNSNPVDLNKLPFDEAAPMYVEYMGGADAIMERAKKAYLEGKYQWVAEVTKQIIYADPSYTDAKLLCADALEQLGYIAESGPWRNEYLMGARELRYGVLPISRSIITSEELDALPLKEVLYLFSIRVNGLEAGEFNYKINFIIPDREEVASTEIKRGIFRFLESKLDEEAVVTVTMNKATLYELLLSNERPPSRDIIVEGDICKWQLFLYVQDNLNTNFNIVTPVND